MVEVKLPIRGFILLPPSTVVGYYGVDRNPFVPCVIEAEIDKNAKLINSYTWSLYPPGWRREAYQLYEDNLVPDTGDDLDLVSNKEIALEIRNIIEPHLGPHEVVACDIWNIGAASEPQQNGDTFLGFDAAYLGGDFFSAVRAGLFGSPWFYEKPNPRLISEYKNALNRFGLFDNAEIISLYIQTFKEEAPSEQDSEFYVWRLNRVEK